MIGNKLDLLEDDDINIKNIEVTKEMGAELAKSWKTDNRPVPFLETSAKTGKNIKEVFESVVILYQNEKAQVLPMTGLVDVESVDDRYSEYTRMFTNIGWKRRYIPPPIHQLPLDSPSYLLLKAIGKPSRIRSREKLMNKVQQSQDYDAFKHLIKFNDDGCC